MIGLGLVIALSARARLHPEEFELALMIQDATVLSRALVPNVPASLVRDYLKITDRIITTFGLRMVGSGRKVMPHGYIRLPTSVASKSFYPRRAGKRIRVSRFEPDLNVIRSWACSK